MTAWAILTAVGTDRLGIVDDLSSILESWQCNIEESKMAVLGDQFAVILLFAGPQQQVQELIDGGERWEAVKDLHIELRTTTPGHGRKQGLVYMVETVSLDAPGIVHAVTRVLRDFGINIEELDTETGAAPFTGSPMFVMRLRVILPEAVAPAAVRESLSRIAQHRDLDIKLEPVLPLHTG